MDESMRGSFMEQNTQQSRISLKRDDKQSFGGFSAVTTISTPGSATGTCSTRQQQQYDSEDDDDEHTVSTTLHEEKGIPSTAKRVLIRLGGFDVAEENDYVQRSRTNVKHQNQHNDGIVESNETGTPHNVDYEQSRSLSLLHKLRQSAFRRKMNSNTNSSTTISHFSTDHTSPAVSIELQQQSITVRTDDLNGLSPTSVRDNSNLSPYIKSILKRKHSSGGDTDMTVNNEDVSPRTLVVGRLERGSLNLRSPMLDHTTITSSPTNKDLILPSIIDSDNPGHDSLVLSDSSFDGEIDGPSEMITASSIVSDTIPTSRFDTVSQSTRELGASSMAFIQQIRGAAFRRKMNVTRSRDSFVEKERIHREQIAASKIQREELEKHKKLEIDIMQQEEEKRKLISHQNRSKNETLLFKARPLPKTTGLNGNGGLVGVPKVEKRPTTVPISPYLGNRRILQSAEASANNDDPTNRHNDRTVEPSGTKFKALPLPKSSSAFGGAGQSGVPKVPKRKVTIPHSPALGIRRQQIPTMLRQVPATESTNSQKNVSVTIKHTPEVYKENQDPMRMLSPIVNATMKIKPYVPYSTRRAVKRAEFEQRRIINEQLRFEIERKEKQKLVKRLQHDLERLRIEI